MYGYIYITTNLINGKKYIGQHKSEVFEFGKYKGSGKILVEAINKYGINCFKTELLTPVNNVPVICDTAEQLNASEEYYIKYYNCVSSSDYYNLCEGGRGTDAYNSLSEEDKVRRNNKIRAKNISRWNTITEEELDARSDKWRETHFSRSEEELKEMAKRNSEAQKRYRTTLTPEQIASNNEKLKIAIQKRLSNFEIEKNRKLKEKITKSKQTEEQKELYKQKQIETHIGRLWYTNGESRIKCIPGTEPEGYYRGGSDDLGAHKYVCYFNDMEFIGITKLCKYLNSIGYVDVVRDKLLICFTGEQKRLFKKYPELSNIIIYKEGIQLSV